MVEARRRPEAAHARSAPSPRLISFFFVWHCGGAASANGTSCPVGAVPMASLR
jgi:hypothetical protein